MGWIFLESLHAQVCLRYEHVSGILTL